MPTIRQQLTLFVDGSESGPLERVRAQFNPAQHRLIKSHVTLCREDELTDLARLRANLDAQLPSLVLEFGPVTRFADGQGVFLPAIGDRRPFDDLRRAVLRGVIDEPRVAEPHLTLMHPRNSTCTDALFAQLAAHQLPTRLTFSVISLIQQVDGGPWTVCEERSLRR